MSEFEVANDGDETACGMKPLRAEDFRPKPKLDAAALKRFRGTASSWVGVTGASGQSSPDKSR